MTVIYLDLYLLLNLSLDCLLLLAADKLTGGGGGLLRCLLGGLLGTLYGGLTLVCPLLEHPLCQALSALVMVLAAFGVRPAALRAGALFLLLSCAFGGLLVLLSMYRGGGGAALSLRTILISAAVCYGLLSLLLRGQFTHTRPGGALEEVTLTHRGRSVTLLALRDTGHTMCDPLTGRPVLVVEGERLRDLLPELFQVPGGLGDPVTLLDCLEGTAGGRRLQLLPYRAVGVDHGLLLALRLERARVGERTYRSCLIALSPTPVSDGGNYSALIGAEP